MSSTSAEKRKELKRAYKESYRPMGVYRLSNTVDGRILVGASSDLQGTFNKLRMQLKMGSYLMNPELQKDWTELGEESFLFEVLEELEPPKVPGQEVRDDLAAMETLWLEAKLKERDAAAE